MMQKPISAAEAAPIRVVIVTLDNHLAGAAERAQRSLRADYPGLELAFHAAADFAASPDSLARCLNDIARGDIIAANMLFLEDHTSRPCCLRSKRARPSATRWSAPCRRPKWCA